MCLAAWRLGALANQDLACLIYREHTVDVSTRNAYFPWEAASGDSKILEAKNIYLWEAITGIKSDVNGGKALKC